MSFLFGILFFPKEDEHGGWLMLLGTDEQLETLHLVRRCSLGAGRNFSFRERKNFFFPLLSLLSVRLSLLSGQSV